MFTKLGRKIITDSFKIQRIESQIVDEADDEYKRFGSKCEKGSDVYYHGGHSHDHDDGMTDDQRYEKAMYQLKCVTVVGLIFVGAQGVGAYLAGSIAIATDCAHLASDLLAFIMSIVALKLTRKGASSHYTFGWHRSEIIGSISSIVFLLTLTIWLLFEAMKRIFIEYDIDGEIMLITAVLSLLFNLILINILHQGPGHDHDHGDGGHSHGHSHGKKEDSHGHGHSHDHGHSHGKEDSHGHSHGETKLGDTSKADSAA